MKSLVIGSQALKMYGLLDRHPADTDILCDSTFYNMFSQNDVPKSFRGITNNTEFFIADDASPYVSDMLILEYCISSWGGFPQKKRQLMYSHQDLDDIPVAPLPVLKMLKLCCVNHLNKPKHAEDLKRLEHVKLNKQLEVILAIREREVRIRLNVSRDLFFNKYNIHRIVDHDSLHRAIVDDPAYLSVVEGGLLPSQAKFLTKSFQEKVQIVREEVAVLVIERHLLPNIAKTPNLMFWHAQQLVKESNKTVKFWIDRFSGDLKDHPEWLAAWAKENNKVIYTDFGAWLTPIMSRPALKAIMLKARQ